MRSRTGRVRGNSAVATRARAAVWSADRTGPCRAVGTHQSTWGRATPDSPGSVIFSSVSVTTTSWAKTDILEDAVPMMRAALTSWRITVSDEDLFDFCNAVIQRWRPAWPIWRNGGSPSMTVSRNLPDLTAKVERRRQRFGESGRLPRPLAYDRIGRPTHRPASELRVRSTRPTASACAVERRSLAYHARPVHMECARVCYLSMIRRCPSS